MSETQQKGRVFWTPAELKLVIDEAALISLDDTEYVWTYLLKAQAEVLPTNRQRKIQGRAVVTPEILRRFKEARAELLAHRAETAPEAPTPPPPPAPVVAPVDRAAVIASLTTIEIFEIVANRIGPFITGFQALAGILKAHIRPPEHTETPATPASEKVVVPPVSATAVPPSPKTPTAPTRPTARRKVLLFGFGTEQETEIRKKAAGFELELMFTSQPKGSPLPKIPVSDWAIVNRGISLSRRAKEALASRPGNDRVVDAGTVDTALQKLADINSRK